MKNKNIIRVQPVCKNCGSNKNIQQYDRSTSKKLNIIFLCRKCAKQQETINISEKLLKINQILSKNLGCDKCDEIDGDYFKTLFPDGQQLVWNSKKKKFQCPRGHRETFEQTYRNESIENVLERLKSISKII